MHLPWLNFFTGAYDKYKDFFKIPYFIFVRDTLSYLALLAMHLAICVQPSQVSFSGLEWVILVFFLGRLLNEVKQIIDMRRTRSANQEKLTLGDYIRYVYQLYWSQNLQRLTTSYNVLQRIQRLTFLVFLFFLPSFLPSFLRYSLQTFFYLPAILPTLLSPFLHSFLRSFLSSFHPFFLSLLFYLLMYLFIYFLVCCCSF